MNTQKINTLTILFDADCRLCSALRTWLQAQPTYAELRFIPAGSDRARHQYPQLDHAQTLTELTVITETGQYYLGAKAWVMVLYALCRYRAMALRLGTPALMPLARRFVLRVSRQRFRLSRYLPGSE